MSDEIKRNGYLRHYIYHTYHKWLVLKYLTKVSVTLLYRGIIHDMSKYYSDEAAGFASARRTDHLPYGHPECQAAGQEIKETIMLHKSRNRHHPEYHERRLNGMTLIDIVEMYCDWKAATQKNANPDLNHSINVNKDRYGISDQLKEIMCNTKV